MSGDVSMQRWAIQIDIEGFGALWGKDAAVLQALSDLMDGIHRIGSRCYPESPYRLFAHQIADGFLIFSEFGHSSLEIPIGMTIALMRHVTGKSGRFCKASIAEGEVADISGCYPDCARSRDDGRIPMGSGIMTIYTVMGTAQINAVKLAGKASGCLVLLDAENRPRVPESLASYVEEQSGLIYVDWIHAQSEAINEIQTKGGLCRPSVNQLEQCLQSYCADCPMPPPEKWVTTSAKYLNLPFRH